MTTSTWLPGNWLQAIGRIIRMGPREYSHAWTDRQQQYAAWDAYYANTIYEAITSGGQRENINSLLGNAAAADLAGLYNPVASVVDLYLHVFAGEFGTEITVEAANAALVQPLERIWGWSNLTIEKARLCRLAATHGLCGLRIVARNDDNPLKRRVYLKPEHPSLIRDVELDDRGNVEAIQLEYTVARGLAEKQELFTIREELTKERIRTWKVDGSWAEPFDLFTMQPGGPMSDYENALGVVPYVLLRHEHDGTPWGRNAFYRARQPLDRLNALLCHVDVEIHRHVRATWLIAAAGAPPAEFTFDDLRVLYVNTNNAASNPMAQALVANLNLDGAISQARLQQELIEDMLPELKATAGKFISGQSGETIAELRKPAEDRLALARTNYEDALTRAQQIALSWGVVLGLWDLGTGTGSRGAADAAFEQGLEDHTFAKRALLGGDMAQQEVQGGRTTGRAETAGGTGDAGGPSGDEAIRASGA